MKKLLILGVLLNVSLGIRAQIVKPVKWSYAAKKSSATEATLFIKAVIDPNWHIYSVNQPDGGPVKTTFVFEKSKSYSLLGKLAEPKPLVKYEEVFSMDVKYFEKSVVFQQRIKLNAKQTVVKGKVEFMACTNKECLPPDEVSFSVVVK